MENECVDSVRIIPEGDDFINPKALGSVIARSKTLRISLNTERPNQVRARTKEKAKVD